MGAPIRIAGQGTRKRIAAPALGDAIDSLSSGEHQVSFFVKERFWAETLAAITEVCKREKVPAENVAENVMTGLVLITADRDALKKVASVKNIANGLILG